MRRCGVCRRAGHTSRVHDNLTEQQLSELRADGLAYLGRGFHELDEIPDQGEPDLLAQLAEGAEDSAHPEAELSPRQAAMREAVGGTPPAVVDQPGSFPVVEVADELLLPAAGGAAILGDFTAYTDPGPPADGADCNCMGDGDWHPVGTGGCILPSAARGGRPVEVLHLPGDCSHCGGGDGGHWAGCLDAVRPGDLASSEVAKPDTPQVTDVGELGPQYVPWRTVFGPAEPIRITMPGVYILGPEEYHADPVPGESLSNSDAKKLIESCPAQFRYDKDNRVREEKDAYDRGHVVHELVLGKGGGIVVLPPEFKDWRKAEAQRIKREARAAGKAPILAADFAASEEMASAMLADPYAKALLTQPGQAEAAMFWLDGSGVVRRCMVDYLPTRKPPGETMIVVDVKTSDEVAPNEDMERKVMNLGYHRQAATIADGILSLGLATDVLVVFLFQSKKPPFLVVPVKLTPRALQIGRIENRAALKQFAQCLATGEWPAYYDPAGDIPEVGLPGWYEKRFDGEV